MDRKFGNPQLDTYLSPPQKNRRHSVHIFQKIANLKSGDKNVSVKARVLSRTKMTENLLYAKKSGRNYFKCRLIDSSNKAISALFMKEKPQEAKPGVYSKVTQAFFQIQQGKVYIFQGGSVRAGTFRGEDSTTLYFWPDSLVVSGEQPEDQNQDIPKEEPVIMIDDDVDDAPTTSSDTELHQDKSVPYSRLQTMIKKTIIDYKGTVVHASNVSEGDTNGRKWKHYRITLQNGRMNRRNKIILTIFEGCPAFNKSYFEEDVCYFTNVVPNYFKGNLCLKNTNTTTCKVLENETTYVRIKSPSKKKKRMRMTQ